MAYIQHTLVMDISPWPSGNGFSGANAWWEHVLNKDEKRRLDNLMGAALLDNEVCDRLLNRRDAGLMDSFGLSQETQTWLRNVKANSLVELAQAIVSRLQHAA